METPFPLRLLSQRGLDALAILLLVGLFVYWATVVNATQSIYAGYDPQFAYFMDSLAPFKGIPYSFADHPGTPVAVLGTLFIALTWLFMGGSSAALIDFHLRNPELFFRIAYAFLFLTHLSCVLAIYFTARSTRRIGPVPAVALAVMYYALDPSALGTLTYWSHASFSFPFGALFLLLLFKEVRHSQGEIPLARLTGLGIGAGVLTSIILYLLPWVVGAVVTVALFYRLKGVSWARTLLASGVLVLSSLVGFFVAIIPHLWKWQSLWRWLLKLLLNQGRFGNGEPGIFSLSATLANLSDFITRMPFLFATIAALLLLWLLLWVIYRRAPRQDAPAWSMAVGLLVQICLLLLITAKAAFYFYLLPVLATVPVLALVLLTLTPEARYVRFALHSLLALVVLSQLMQSIPRRAALTASLAAAITQDQSSLQGALQSAPGRLKLDSAEIHIVWAYGLFEQCNLLLDGNYYAGFAFSSELSALCPRQHFLPHGSDSAFVNGERLALDEVASHGWIIVMRSAEADYILALFPSATVQTIPSSSSGLGDLVLIYP